MSTLSCFLKPNFLYDYLQYISLNSTAWLKSSYCCQLLPYQMLQIVEFYLFYICSVSSGLIRRSIIYIFYEKTHVYYENQSLIRILWNKFNLFYIQLSILIFPVFLKHFFGILHSIFHEQANWRYIFVFFFLFLLTFLLLFDIKAQFCYSTVEVFIHQYILSSISWRLKMMIMVKKENQRKDETPEEKYKRRTSVQKYKSKVDISQHQLILYSR